MKKLIIVCGDHHGTWDLLFNKIDAQNLSNCLFIHVGDGGEGFIINRPAQIRQFDLLNNRFKKRGIEYWSIRGNHSDPQYFDGSVSFSHFKLIPDYSLHELNGEKFLFVGGAISIDRKWRKKDISWWENEGFILKPELIQKCDVLIAHSAPYWIGPFDKEGISGWCQKDETLWDECYKERIDMAELVKSCGAKRSYHGHFHCSSWVDFQDCYANILDILEFKEHKS